MAPPRFTEDLPETVFLVRTRGDRLTLSEGLVDLLRTNRENYAWPFSSNPSDSQIGIVEIEQFVGERINALSRTASHQIIVRVSKWANNRRHGLVVSTNDEDMEEMYESVRMLLDDGTMVEGLEKLSSTQGISLVIATKIFRFCRPMDGAAVDRHASYFFNSLPVIVDGAPPTRSTGFRREWVSGDHKNSRLATFPFASEVFFTNLNEYATTYLPLLRQIVAELNEAGVCFMCAATHAPKAWTPADVEMGAFFWWAQYGSR